MKTKKLIVIFILILILYNFFNIKYVYAANDETSDTSMSLTEILSKGKTYKETGSNNAVISDQDALNKFVPLGQILVIVANAAILIVTAIMAVKWILANPEQKSKLKQQLIGLVISIVVVYGAVGIWAFIKALMDSF